MRLSDPTMRPSPRLLRQFGGLWLVFFGVLSCWQAFVNHRITLAIVSATLAIVVGSAGLLRPTIVRPIFVTWMILTLPIRWLVSQILLASIYYGVFLPIGLVFRLVGYDPLALKRPEKDSYWTPKHEPHDIRRYFKQF